MSLGHPVDKRGDLFSLLYEAVEISMPHHLSDEDWRRCGQTGVYPPPNAGLLRDLSLAGAIEGAEPARASRACLRVRRKDFDMAFMLRIRPSEVG